MYGYVWLVKGWSQGTGKAYLLRSRDVPMPLAHSRITFRCYLTCKTTSPYRLNIFSRLSAIPASFSSAVVLETTTNAKNTPAINLKKKTS